MSWWKKIVKKAVPIAASFIPGVGPIAATLAGAAMSQWDTSGGKKEGGGGAGGAEGRNRAAFEGLAEGVEGRATRMSDAYEERAMNYDPYESMRTAISGTWDMMLPQMRGQQVGMGRLKTGFAGGDENAKLQSLIASHAQTAEERGFQNMRDIGGYGERAMGTAMDARFGMYATEREAREKEKASKRGMWGNILGQGISAAGQILAAKQGAK